MGVAAQQSGPIFTPSDVRSEAVALLAADASSQQVQSQILGGGGVEIMMHAIHDPSLQQDTARLLTTLATGPCSDSFADHFMRGSGIASMQRFLQTSSSEELVLQILSMLSQLVAADNSGGFSQAMHTSDYLSVMPRLMQHHHEDIRSNAAFIVKILSLSQTSIQASADLCAACMALLFSLDSMSAGASEGKILAAESLRNFARWPCNAMPCWTALAGAKHMLAKLAEIIQVPTREGTLEAACCSFLACLSTHSNNGDAAYLALLQEAGIQCSLIGALSSPHLVVQRHAAQTLANVMGHDTLGTNFRDDVYNFGGLPLLHVLLHKDDQEMKQAIVSALASLAQKPEAAAQLDLQSFMAMMQSPDPNIRSSTLAIVDLITRNDVMKRAQLTGSVQMLPTLVQMMASPDAGTQRRAISAVCSFAHDSATWRTIRECNGMQGLVESMRSADESVLLQVGGCLVEMVADPENALALLSCGGQTALVPLLARASPELQRAAATALAAMGRGGGPPAVTAIVDAGCVDPLIHLLHAGTGKDAPRSQQAVAADALQALAILSTDPRASATMVAKCLDKLFDLVEQYDAAVQSQASYLLLNLSKCGPQVRTAMVQQAKVGAMLSFMSSDFEAAQEVGVSTLSAALSDGKSRAKHIDRLLADESFIETLTKTYTSTSKQVRENASVILTKLLENKTFRVKYVCEGGFGATNKLVQANKDCPMKTRNGVAAMETLMTDPELDLQLRTDPKAREVVKSFVERLASASTDKSSGANLANTVGVLVRLCSDESCVTELTQNRRAVETLLHQLSAGITKDSMKENMLQILEKCCQNEDCAVLVTRLGGHSAVCSAISASDRQATSAKLQIRGLGVAVLQALAQHSKCRLSMAQGDTRAMLVDTLKTTADSGIQLSALRCLVHLTERKDIATMLLQEDGLDECLRLLHVFSDEGSELEALEKATLTQALVRCLAGFAACMEAVDVVCGCGDLAEASSAALRHMSALASLLESTDSEVQLGACQVLIYYNQCRYIRRSRTGSSHPSSSPRSARARPSRSSRSTTSAGRPSARPAPSTCWCRCCQGHIRSSLMQYSSTTSCQVH
jgi:hypothetical protein